MVGPAVLLLVGLALGVTPAIAQQVDDCLLAVIIEDGDVYDGRGSDPVVTDVGILGDRIAALGDLDACAAGRRLDARGLAVVPGFIDIHSHGTRGVFRYPLAENLTRQGVTTAIGGPDGSSPYPIGEYLAQLDATPPAVNFGLMVGHGTIRREVMGNEDRAPTTAELDTMQAMVGRAMADGAFGLSSGLKYVPGAYAGTEEVIELARVAGSFGGIYISHMREEGLQLLDAVRETIRVGEEGGLPTQITHHKVVGAPMWGASTESLALVDAARTRGVDVTLDQYPYTASSTRTVAMFPPWAQEGGRQKFLERLRDPATRTRIKADIARRIELDRGGGDPKNVQLVNCEWDQSLNGKTLADVTRGRGREVTFETGAETAMEIEAAGGCAAVYHAMTEEDVERIMRYRGTMIASDGWIFRLGDGVPHPRAYGTFPRVLGRYGREKGILELKDAVRKMTSLPAQRIGQFERGLLRPGMKADVTIFDPDTIIDRAEFGKPHQYPDGVYFVIVNGKVVLDDGKMTALRPGTILYGAGKK